VEGSSCAPGVIRAFEQGDVDTGPGERRCSQDLCEGRADHGEAVQTSRRRMGGRRVGGRKKQQKHESHESMAAHALWAPLAYLACYSLSTPYGEAPNDELQQRTPHD
jgi:hypothetical protein